MRVHSSLGPGLLESVYERCLCYELDQNNIPYARQVELPLVYRGTKLDCGYRADMIVGKRRAVGGQERGADLATA